MRVDVLWSSRNPEIASVSAGGFVRGLRPGSVAIVASAEGVETVHVVEVLENPVRSIELSPDIAAVRTGDVVRFEATPRDESGAAVTDISLTYAVGGEGIRSDLGASVYEDGAFVAERSGNYRIVASAGSISADAVVEVRPRDVAQEPVQVGIGLISHAPSSDLWVFQGLDGRDYAYVGTHDGGQRMYAWDVTDPGNPVLTDSVSVDARVVNDVKVNEAATLAVITREGASDRQNGIVILDLADPAHPQVASTYTEGLTGGVHNTFIVGDLVYAIHDGTLDVHIVDISDPAAPREVGRWGIDRAGKYLHDIWVVGGIAYVSYWGDGVWILDVGDGRWGGTPTEPAVISSLAYPEGSTHVAFPYRNSEGRNYLFVGDEIFDCAECVSRTAMGSRVSRGFIHILSIDDLENPVEVGRYDVPEAGAHNIWVEDDRLYVAYYQAGLRVVDVSGELRGDLYKQGREIAWFSTGHPEGSPANDPTAWGPQPYLGNIFVSDMNSGLWVIRLEPPEDPLFP
jgi:choice-of-anchor B domain-containing protein